VLYVSLSLTYGDGLRCADLCLFVEGLSYEGFRFLLKGKPSASSRRSEGL
jgi:hypothetical protein